MLKKYLFLIIFIFSLFTTSTFAYANIPFSESEKIKYIALPLQENDTKYIEISISEEYSVIFRVINVNGMVYANAHGKYTNTSNGNTSSTYGMYVSFTVTNNNISIGYGDQFTAYHNASTSGYTAHYEKSITGENTNSCTAKTKYTLSNSPNSEITIKLEINSQGISTVYFNGNYDQKNVIWDI